MKYYFRDEDEEYCYSLNKFDEGTKLRLAVPDKSKDHFYCRAIGEVCMTEDNPCGKQCEDYEPKNGTSGMCKHKTFCHTGSNETYIKQGKRAIKFRSNK